MFVFFRFSFQIKFDNKKESFIDIDIFPLEALVNSYQAFYIGLVRVQQPCPFLFHKSLLHNPIYLPSVVFRCGCDHVIIITLLRCYITNSALRLQQNSG